VAGALVAVSGAASALFVVIANAWMNTPTGFRLQNGAPVDVDPIAAMLTPAAFHEILHMLLAAYAATGFAVAGIHGFMLLRDHRNAFHRRALVVALMVGVPAAIVQPISGDISARYVAQRQPPKLAAMEGQFRTESGAPLRLGGIPDVVAQRTRWANEIPNGLSLLAFHDPHAVVRGLDAVPRRDWPPVPVVHVAFQIMVALGTYLALLGVWVAIETWRRRDLPANRWLMRAVAIASPMGFLCIEAGWTVTEVGRQPWVIFGVMRTADAVTPMPGLIVPFLVISALYCFLGVVVAWLLYDLVMRSPIMREGDGTMAPVAA
jgi:cytochrome d ubiquinol oxidase subunit I